MGTIQRESEIEIPAESLLPDGHAPESHNNSEGTPLGNRLAEGGRAGEGSTQGGRTVIVAPWVHTFAFMFRKYSAAATRHPGQVGGSSRIWLTDSTHRELSVISCATSDEVRMTLVEGKRPSPKTTGGVNRADRYAIHRCTIFNISACWEMILKRISSLGCLMRSATSPTVVRVNS